MVFVLVAGLAGTALAVPAAGQAVTTTYVVTGTDDLPDTAAADGICRTTVGSCSLRAALELARTDGTASLVRFAIAGTSYKTIQLGSTLPALSDLSGPTTIDGFSQSGSAPNTDPLLSNAQLRIQIRGGGWDAFHGLMITSPGNVVRGLAMWELKSSIRLSGEAATGNVIAGNTIGTNAAGAGPATAVVPGGHGVHMQQGASGNRVGGTAPADRNVISGNAQNGVSLYNFGTNDNVIVGNLIGLSPAGGPRPNQRHGVDINTGAARPVVGGAGAGEGNVISANVYSGVEVSHGESIIGTRIVGNRIGTTASGHLSPPGYGNRMPGIRIEELPVDTRIEGNTIAGNAGGIFMDKRGDGTVITGNRIGVGAGGQVIGNGDFAVRIDDVGSVVIGPGNTIRGHGNGIQVLGAATGPVTVTRNRTTDQIGLAIDLEPLGGPNAVDGPGPGPNGGIDAPTIGSATVPGIVAGVACAGCTVEVFFADADAGRYGEGRDYLFTTTADAGGGFSAPLPAGAAGQVVTATATAADGATSEFARNVAVGSP